MKIKDVKEPAGDRTVGNLIDYLSQFPREMPIITRAEPDACRQNGYPFFYVHASWSTWKEAEAGSIPDGVDENEGELEVKSVIIFVDH